MSAMAFLAGLGAGYLNAKDKNRENDRQAAKDKREQDLFDMTMAEKKQAKDDRDALRNAGQDAVVTPEQGPPTEAAMAAQDPLAATQPAIGYMADNGASAKHFATQGLADAAATQMNSLDGKFSRQQAAMQGVGDYAGAQKLQLDNMTLKKHASDLLKEGTGDALSAAIGGKSPEEVKSIYNQNGGRKVRDITITPFEVNHPVLGKQQSAKITGTFEDGTPLNVPDALQMQSQLLGVAKKFDLDTKWAEIGNKKAHDDGTLAVAQQNADTNEKWRADQASNAASKTVNSVDRMSEIDKATLLNINKQRDVIHAALVKAQAEGSFDPASPGAKLLGTQMAALGLKENQIHSRYSDGANAPDPLGMRKQSTAPASAAAPATAPASSRGSDTRITPQQQKANDSDRVTILSRELQDAQGRLASGDPRAQGDIDGISRELGRAAPQAAPATPQRIAATGIAAPAPAAAAPAPVQAAPAMATQGVQAPKPLSTIDQIQANNIASVTPLAQQFKQAEAQFVAAARSGDQKVMAQYMQAKETLRAQLEAQVTAKFGNNAQNVLQQLLSR